MLALALGLAEQPDLTLALAEGRIDASQARAIHDATTALPPTVRDQVVASLVTDPERPARCGRVRPVWCASCATGTTPCGRSRRTGCARSWPGEIAAAAPECVQDGELVAVRGRRVEYACGTLERSGSLVLHGPEPDLAAAYDRLDADARDRPPVRAPETLDQLRYDLAIAALTDGALGLTLTPPRTPNLSPQRPARPRPRARRQVRVDVVVAADTLLGVDDRPATLRTAAGDVPISAAVARQLAHDPTRPGAGSSPTPPPAPPPTSPPATPRPSGSPSSSRSATGTPPASPPAAPAPSSSTTSSPTTTPTPTRGGPTTPANLAATGKRDHQAKTDQLITVTGNANTVLTYHTGAGHTYPSTTPPLHRPITRPTAVLSSSAETPCADCGSSSWPAPEGPWALPRRGAPAARWKRSERSV